MATLAYIKGKVGDAITASVSENGKSQSEKITEETCKLLADKIPDITTKITNGILANLKTKIDSEAFSTDFVNVLQQKLLEENKTSEPFLMKFSTLFDNIIKKAEEKNDNVQLATAVLPENEGELSNDENKSTTVTTGIEPTIVSDADTNKPSDQLGGNAHRITRRGKRKVKMQTRKHKRRTNKRRNKKAILSK